MAHWTDQVAMGMLCGVLIAAAVWDVRTEKVPNKLILPAIGLGFVWWTVCGFWVEGAVGLEESLLGFAAGFLPFAVIFALGSLGGGDVKTMGAVGALSASWQCVASTVVYAVLIAAVMSVYVMIRKGLVRQTFRRIFDAAVRRGNLDDEKTPRIPFCVAICIGGIIAGTEVLLGIRVAIGEFVGRGGL